MSDLVALPSSPTIDSSGVGRLTIASTELVDVRRAVTFAAGLDEEARPFPGTSGETGLMVHPGLAFALQYNAQGRLGVDKGGKNAWLGAVHAETDLRIYRPFRIGDVVTTQGRVVTRRQLASGVYNLERYRMIDDTGELVAEMDFGLIFRGARLEGGERQLDPAPPKPVLPSQGTPELLHERFVPRNLLHHYTGCTGIFAAIHTDRSLALAAGFPDIILQGSATKSMAMSAVVAAFFDGDLTRMTRFCGQLRGIIPAETAFRIESLGTMDDERQRHVFFRVLNASGDAAVANGLVSGWRQGCAP